MMNTDSQFLTPREEMLREQDSDAMTAALARGPETGLSVYDMTASDVADLEDLALIAEYHAQVDLFHAGIY